MIYDSFEPHCGWMMSSEYFSEGVLELLKVSSLNNLQFFLLLLVELKNIMAVEKMNVFVYVER